MLGRLFGYGKKKKEKEGDKNYDPKSKYRQGLLESPVTTYSEGEMKIAKEKIVERLPTQPKFDEKKMRDAGPHMKIVGSYNKKLGEVPFHRKRSRNLKNPIRRRIIKTPTNFKNLKKRHTRQDSDRSKLSRISSPPDTDLNTVIAPLNNKHKSLIEEMQNTIYQFEIEPYNGEDDDYDGRPLTPPPPPSSSPPDDALRRKIKNNQGGKRTRKRRRKRRRKTKRKGRRKTKKRRKRRKRKTRRKR